MSADGVARYGWRGPPVISCGVAAAKRKKEHAADARSPSPSPAAPPGPPRPRRRLRAKRCARHARSPATLGEIGKLLKANPALKLYVVGHTDAVGAVAYNKDLSEKRAAAVVQYLVRQHGIAADRLVPAGVGPLAPVATNATEEGRAKNRRVELVVRP